MMNSKLLILLCALVLPGVAGCRPTQSALTTSAALPTTPVVIPNEALLSEAWAAILRPHVGSNRVDREIVRWQQEVRAGVDTNRALERLGWAFVAKARETFDDGFYVRAEQCAAGLDSRRPGSSEAMLLRGHVLHNQHQFKEAEPLARRLVAQRGAPFDHGLLGDLLMEQGKLDEAARAYQQMLDLRPDLQSYARGGHLRWLKGDLTGAIELMEMAARSASPADASSAAWVHTRLALLRLQAGALGQARQGCATAVQFQRDYPPALLAHGRVLMAEGQSSNAVTLLQRAVGLNPLPEYQWALAEALRAAGRAAEATAVEGELERTGAFTDPRTYSLYLATKGKSATQAVTLAEKELQERADVFTHDALAWSLAAAGRMSEARTRMKLALAEGTQDARLFLHAAFIAERCGDMAAARRWADQAAQHIHMLLPSEQELLLDVMAVATVQKTARDE